MRRTCLAVCAVYLIGASVFLLRPAHAETPDTKAIPTRGIAVLASSIGSDFTPEYLADFVQQGKFSPVVVDWAWITYHWSHTDFAAVNRFLDLMAARKVPVAAMYRPRFLSNPTVPTQTDQDGKGGVDHVSICYSDASARKWGISWGEKILEKCPSFREIIIYNPVNLCHCPKCIAASKSGSHTAVMGFLSEAKSAWRAKQPEVKLGVVYMPVPEFWKAGLAVVDVAHPYLLFREDTDAAKEIANIKAVGSVIEEKMGSCLGKVTWGATEKISMSKLKAIDSLARENAVPYFLWTFNDLFLSDKYDPKAVAQALDRGSSPDGESAGKAHADAVTSVPQPALSDASARQASTSTLEGIPAEIRQNVDGYLNRMVSPDPGSGRFDALNDLIQKVKEADPETRRFMLSMVLAAMMDTSRNVNRFQCCKVIRASKYEEGVPYLIEVLQKDRSEIMRSVAVEALADFTGNAAAHDALVQAARTEKSPRVRETLAKHLGKDVPALEARPAPAPATAVPTPAQASAVQEPAPSGPPTPPPGPAKPVAKPLPWPFPGDCRAQKVFANYQQATDSYIHGALDFIQPPGTPVTAVASGFVAVISTNYPQWTTHHFFIVTPEKGGDKGWCYVHVDPHTFTFKEGDFVEQGQLLGNVVKFSIGGRPSSGHHLHLHYVSFTRDSSGKIDVRSLLDPLYFFDWKDTEPPAFQPLRFVSEGTPQQFQADAGGVVTVNGKVDILAAITDSAFPGHMGNLGVPVVMLSISDGKHTMQKLVLDLRGEIVEKRRIKPLYLTSEEKRALFNPSGFPRYQVLRVTKTDGDGKITPRDANECWDTTALDSKGRPVWPDGRYSVNVYAWDISGNRGVVGAMVQVKNEPSAR